MNIDKKFLLTPKQKMVFDTIVHLTKRDGHAPTLSEIARWSEISLSMAAKYSTALEEHGLLVPIKPKGHVRRMFPAVLLEEGT